ncbi:hypothetical protein Ancab_006581 [Ancistrocladus abbreviatus]
MKLVEEFYRAYQALAERSDHATGIIRQAHWTMEENQIQFVMDDGSAVSVNNSNPRTPKLPPFLRASFDPDELHDNVVGISPPDFHLGRTNGTSTEESNSSGSTKGLKQLPQGRARKVKCGVDRDCGGIGLGATSAKSIVSRPGVGNDGTLSPT